MPEGLDQIRALYAAINAGELETALELMSPDVSWSRPPDVPVTGTIHGRDKVTRMWDAFGDPLTGFEIEPTRLRELGEGVLAHVTFRGTVKGADGEDSSFEFAGVQSFRLDGGGLIADVREFRTVPEGEADLG